MPNWIGSDRKSELPSNWRELRRKVALRAGWRCQNFVDGARCDRPGSHCDHIEPGQDHSLNNLRWLCPPCHNTKSGREGALARPRLNRAPEPHPGLRPHTPPPATFLAPARPTAG